MMMLWLLFFFLLYCHEKGGKKTYMAPVAAASSSLRLSLVISSRSLDTPCHFYSITVAGYWLCVMKL